MQIGIRTGLIAGFVLGAAVMVTPGCKYLGMGQPQLSEAQVAQLDHLAGQVAQIDEVMPVAQAELAKLQAAYDAMAAAGGEGSEVATEASEVIGALKSAIEGTKEERAQIMDSLGQLQAAILPDGTIDVGATLTAAAPLLAMVPGLNFIVPLLPVIGAIGGGLWRNKAVKHERAENAINLGMTEAMSIGSIGIIDSIQELKSAMPSSTEAGQLLRNVLANQPQQSRFLVNAVRGNGFAGERMGPLLASAQGKLTNQRREGR